MEAILPPLAVENGLFSLKQEDRRILREKAKWKLMYPSDYRLPRLDRMARAVLPTAFEPDLFIQRASPASIGAEYLLLAQVNLT